MACIHKGSQLQHLSVGFRHQYLNFSCTLSELGVVLEPIESALRTIGCHSPVWSSLVAFRSTVCSSAIAPETSLGSVDGGRNEGGGALVPSGVLALKS